MGKSLIFKWRHLPEPLSLDFVGGITQSQPQDSGEHSEQETLRQMLWDGLANFAGPAKQNGAAWLVETKAES